MVLTEVDMAHQLSFASSSLSGAGSMSQSFALFSIVNSTSLASIFSASSSWSWGSGSTQNMTQQGGWIGSLIHTMGLSSGSAGTSTISGGEYVVGNIINVSAAPVAAGSAGGSNMSMSLFGVIQQLRGVVSTSASAISNAGTASADLMSNSLTANIQAISNVGTAQQVVFSAGGLSAVSGVTGVSSYGSAFLALSTAGDFTAFTMSASSSIGSSLLSVVSVSVTGASKSESFSLVGSTSNSNIVSSIGLVAGSILTGATSASMTVFTVAPTAAGITAWTGGPSHSSFTAFSAAPTVLSAVTSVSFTTGAANFTYQNSNAVVSFSSLAPSYFSCGIMATAGIPANITVGASVGTSLTETGSVADLQPWFALCGS
jgi:hypothetical protein